MHPFHPDWELYPRLTWKQKLRNFGIILATIGAVIWTALLLASKAIT